jgi:hypothetical protein
MNARDLAYGFRYDCRTSNYEIASNKLHLNVHDSIITSSHLKTKE